MNNYIGPYAHLNGIHKYLSRNMVAHILRQARKRQGRAHAQSYRDWLIYLSTYPGKPIDEHWIKRETNKNQAALRRHQEAAKEWGATNEKE